MGRLLIAIVPALLLSSCANPFAGGCGGPSLLETPGFVLYSSDENTVLTVAPGTTLSIPICAVRYRFFDDPITLEVSGLPGSVEFEDTMIRKGSYSTTLLLEADPHSDFTWPHRIVVKGIAGDHDDSWEFWIQVGPTPQDE